MSHWSKEEVIHVKCSLCRHYSYVPPSSGPVTHYYIGTQLRQINVHYAWCLSCDKVEFTEWFPSRQEVETQRSKTKELVEQCSPTTGVERFFARFRIGQKARSLDEMRGALRSIDALAHFLESRNYSGRCLQCGEDNVLCLPTSKVEAAQARSIGVHRCGGNLLTSVAEVDWFFGFPAVHEERYYSYVGRLLHKREVSFEKQKREKRIPVFPSL